MRRLFGRIDGLDSGQRSGYGSLAASPPDWVFHDPFPQFGHGGRLFVEPTSMVLPQLVQE